MLVMLVMLVIFGRFGVEHPVSNRPETNQQKQRNQHQECHQQKEQKMQPTYVSSSNINAIGYQLGRLYIRFNSGVSYEYEHTPYSVYDALVKAESVGQFFHRFVRGRFKYARLDHDPFVNASEKAA